MLVCIFKNVANRAGGSNSRIDNRTSGLMGIPKGLRVCAFFTATECHKSLMGQKENS